MVSPYIKAIILTILLVLFGLYIISQIDLSKERDLKSQLDEMIFQIEMENYLYQEYQWTKNDTLLCNYFESVSERAENITNNLAEKVEEYEKNNLFNFEYEKITDRYYLAKAKLYSNYKMRKAYCPEINYNIILFFYKLKEDCPECNIQGKILIDIIKKDNKVKVFAFPYDSELPFIKFFVAYNKVKQAPTIIINEKYILTGLKTEEEIRKYLE